MRPPPEGSPLRLNWKLPRNWKNSPEAEIVRSNPEELESAVEATEMENQLAVAVAAFDAETEEEILAEEAAKRRLLKQRR